MKKKNALPCLICGFVTDTDGFVCSRCRTIGTKKYEDAVPVSATEVSGEKKEEAPPKKILVIDDEKEITENFREILQEHDYQVVTAQNGMEGMQKVLEEKPDLIILDILMPEMTGYEFVKKLKEQEDISDTPIIVMTARGDMETFFSPSEFDTFFTKPAQMEELLEAIERIIH